MLEYVIAVLICTGSKCAIVQPQVRYSYPTAAACEAALSTKLPAVQELADAKRVSGQTASVVCVDQTPQIVEVEQPYYVLDTSIAHSTPSANSPYVGSVEKGTRVLVTGLVTGTQWVRVLLSDGNTGYVFADHLRKVGAVASPTPLPAPQPAAPVTVTLPPVASPTAPVAPPPAASVPAPALPAVAASLREFRDCAHCPIMVLLSAGTFTMGSNDDATERPIHTVNLRAFAIGKYEITADDWSACVEAGGCAYKPVKPDASPERRAMTNLSWDDAVQYVRWLEKLTGKPYRLPSEAEWEYAARAGSKTRFAWGDQPVVGKANCRGCDVAYDITRPVDIGSYAPNAWGLFDMEGGVAEWVEDCWHSSYQVAPADGGAWRTPNCGKHVLRGGSWNNPPGGITVSTRNFYDLNVRYPANGLRVAVGQP